MVLIRNKRMTKALRCLLISIFSIIVSVLSGVANKASAQSLDNVFVSLDIKEAGIVRFFEAIEQQTFFTFVYDTEVVASKKRMTLVDDRISVRKVMDFCTTQGDLAYMVSNTTISVKTNINNKRQKNKDQEFVNGTVFFNGAVLPGVNVSVLGTSKGVVTDFEGRFSIDAQKGDVLLFSYVGFSNKEVVIDDLTSMEVLMEEDINTLEQIIVVGYGTSTKKALTTAISTIKGKDAIDGKPFLNTQQALNGKLAGVQVVQQSGSPGSPVSIRVRGLSSLNANNNPLYVVDGVQVNNLEGLNPNDVADISVLKDAASSAIYGSRASNGVVLITTKRGVPGKSAISFSSYIGQNQIVNTVEVLNSEQYLDYLNTALINSGEAPQQDPFGGQYNTDWQKELYDPGRLQNYQISFSGGSDKGAFYLSGGYQEESGTIAQSGFERFALRVNQDHQLFENFKIGSSIQLSRTNFDVINDNQRVNQGGVVLGALQTPPIIPVQNPDGTYPDNPFQGGLDNPIALIRGENRQFNTSKVIANIYGKYDFSFGLQFKSSIGIDYNNSKFNRFLDPFITSNGRANRGRDRESQLFGQAQNQTFMETVWTLDNTLTYTFEILEDINMGVLAGFTAQRSRYESTDTEATGFRTAAIKSIEGATLITKSEEDIQEWANNSLFYRIDLNYKERYFLSSSVRRDGSSRFGRKQLYGVFPSISAGWLMSDEAFLENLSGLRLLKLRYSFGTTGNQFIDNYAWRGLLEADANYTFGGLASGFRTAQVQNPDLKWETTKEHNIGMDLGLLDNRITINADVYFKKSEDALLRLQLPLTTGFDEAFVNAAEISNHGIEISVNGKITRTDNFSWDVTANYSQNKSEVDDLKGNVLTGGNVNDIGSVIRTEEGQPLGNYYGLVALGVNPLTGNLQYQDQLTEDIDGDGILDLGDGVIDEKDRTIIGNALPDFTWGVTNTLLYKGLELTLFFQGVQGQDIFNATRFELENQATTKNQSIAVLDRWTPSNTDASLPRAVFGDLNNALASTRWIEDGSYVKLREVTLAYNFPKKWIEKLKLTKLKVYAQGRNLITWTAYTGYDPEVSREVDDPLSLNIDYGTYPQVKTIIGGLSLRF